MAVTTDTAWTELHASLRGFVRRRVREAADADDIVQQVFLRVHQALPTLRDADKLHAWMYQTTRRVIADYYRSPAQRREVLAGTADDVAPVEPSSDGIVADDQRAQRELAGCLKPLMRRLGDREQEALRLVEFDGLTQGEAARRLGLTVSGMKSRVQRARAHLRRALEDCCRVALDRRGGVIEFEHHGDGCGSDSCGCREEAL